MAASAAAAPQGADATAPDTEFDALVADFHGITLTAFLLLPDSSKATMRTHFGRHLMSALQEAEEGRKRAEAARVASEAAAVAAEARARAAARDREMQRMFQRRDAILDLSACAMGETSMDLMTEAAFPYLCGRPLHRFPPFPPELAHECFRVFVDAFENPTRHVTVLDFACASSMAHIMCGDEVDDASRVAVLQQCLRAALVSSDASFSFRPVSVDSDGSKNDGTLIAHVDGARKAFLLSMTHKPIVSPAGDSYMQNAHYCYQLSRRSAVPGHPMFMLNIDGDKFGVNAYYELDYKWNLCVAPVIPKFHVFAAANTPSGLVLFAHVLAAIRAGAACLRSAHVKAVQPAAPMLAVAGGKDVGDHTLGFRHVPDITSVAAIAADAPRVAVTLHGWFAPPQLLFNASVGGEAVLVKCAATYGLAAHLRAAEQGCAPRLLGYEMIGRMHVVIMEKLLPDTWTSLHVVAERARRDPEMEPARAAAVAALRAAIDEYRGEGPAQWVHGDLQMQNIFVHNSVLQLPSKPAPAASAAVLPAKLVQVVDWDWAGKRGEVQYPMFTNMAEKGLWAPTAVDMEGIEPEHDDFLIHAASVN